MKTKRFLAALLSLMMILGMMPTVTFAAYDSQGTTYVKVHDVDEIVPNAR